MTTLYQDLFTGSGDLSTHNPDVGGAYTSDGDLTNMVLDGSGGLPSSTVAPDWNSTLTAAPTGNYTLTVKFTVASASGMTETAYVSVYSLGIYQDAMRVFISAGDSASSIQFNAYNSTGDSLYNYNAGFTPSGSEQVATIAAVDGAIVATLDGVTLTPSYTAPPYVPNFFPDTLYGLAEAAVNEGGSDLVLTEISVVGDTGGPPPITNSGSIDGTLTALTGTIAETATVNKFQGSHGGKYRLYALGSAGYTAVGFLGAHSGDWTLDARSGAQLGGTLSTGTLTASGTATITGTFTGAVPATTLSASGTGTNLGRASPQHRGKYTVSARSGARAAGSLPVGTISATATQGGVGRARLTAPAGTLSAQATLQNFGRAELTVRLPRSIYGVMRGRNPRGRLAASASQAVTLAYEGYSVTLIPTELGYETRTTHLTASPFDHIVRFGSAYYGIGPTGVYELTGSTYDGTAIVATIETAPLSEPANLKRPRAMFVGGRLAADFTGGVKVGETGSYAYGQTVRAGTRNSRVLFGRGVISRYLGFVFTNTDGSDFQLDDITPEIDVQRRTVGGIE